MRNWRVYENEEHTYVMVDESLPKQQITVNGEECFGGMSISDPLAQRLVKKFGAYCFDLDGMHVFEPERRIYQAAH
ncbi:MAG: hypothetical protein ACSHXK_07585 [Oceanococcus sp.]